MPTKMIWNECEVRRREAEKANSQQRDAEDAGPRDRPSSQRGLRYIWRAWGKPAPEPQDGAFACRIAKSHRILKRNLLKGR